MLTNELKKGSAEFLILSLLEHEPRHGYDLSQLIELRSSGVLHFHVASLYPMLYRMERRGWIAGRWVEKAGQRRRRYYTLTATGRKVLAERRKHWSAFMQAVQAAVGEEVLGGEGEDSDFEAAGAEEMQRWIDDNGVEFDPSLNTTIRDGQVAPADDSLSFAVSEGAKAGQEEQPNSALAAQLPDSQRCGR